MILICAADGTPHVDMRALRVHVASCRVCPQGPRFRARRPGKYEGRSKVRTGAASLVPLAVRIAPAWWEGLV